MGTRDKDHQRPPHHHPLLSSLVVRPSDTDGGAAAVSAGGVRTGRAVDYEPGEVRRDPPLFSRSDRFSDDTALHVACKNLGLEEGYRGRAVSTSPVRRRDADIYNSDFDRPGGLSRGREVGRGRDLGRHRDPSPPYSRGRVGGRPMGRGFDAPAVGPGPHRGEGLGRNNPNVRPREGDWICPDPLCGNLNFARREHCNNCNRSKYALAGSPPRRGYPGPPPSSLLPPRRYPGPPMDRSPVRAINGYKSPPRGWARDVPRDFGVGGGLPPPRPESRFSDLPLRRDRPDFPEDDYRGRNKFERPMAMEWGHRDRGREGLFNERKGYERRLPSPPPPIPQLPPHRGGGRWGRDIRERSRSPVRGGGPPPRRDMYMDRGRDDRRGGVGGGRDRIGGVY